MKFGPVPLDEAVGAILAHSVAVAGGKLRKGKTLDARDIAQLRDAGNSEVIVARMSAEDVHEDLAAAELADAMQVDGLTATAASTGRVNIVAQASGIVEVNAAAIHAVNAVSPDITVATIPEWQRVAAGDLVATIKIIPYATRKDDLARAVQAAKDGLLLHRPKFTTATLIETNIGADAPPLKGRRVLSDRLARLDMTLTNRVIVSHVEVDLARAIAAAEGEVVFLLTASATSDSADVGPAALLRAGGQLERFGMPVDPGNLLFVGTHKNRPLIGLPGCARSPALNGADWVLERIICTGAISTTQIARMGVGGLLKEIPSRPRPRLTSD